MANEIREEIKRKLKPKTITGLVFLVVFAAITILGFVFHDRLFSAEGWCMTYDTGSDLFNGVLHIVPSVVGSIQVLFIALLVLYIVCPIIARVFHGNPRRVTIGKLISSIFKVVVWVVAVIVILAVWGVNVAALIAGAGVLTLVIGLGMQSLIADVVAGIFIVCDGTLQVGDIVTIDGWRGTVQEIGIRNTKLINYSGDIRITNNSEIKTFINQSRVNSYPLVTIGVEYGADLKKIEEVFSAERDRIKEMCPHIIEGPDYKGVDALADSSVNLLFGATCKEADFAQTQRDMRRALKIVFEEHGISVPFPQVDVHFDKGDK